MLRLDIPQHHLERLFRYRDHLLAGIGTLFWLLEVVDGLFYEDRVHFIVLRELKFPHVIVFQVLLLLLWNIVMHLQERLIVWSVYKELVVIELACAFAGVVAAALSGAAADAELEDGGDILAVLHSADPAFLLPFQVADQKALISFLRLF